MVSLSLSASSPSFQRVVRPAPLKVAPGAAAAAGLTIGIVCNPKAHRNHGAEYEAGVPGAESVTVAAPRTREALGEVMADFAARGIDLLVIDGGDGTVRDVLTAAADRFGRRWPRVIVIPSGKTNALAIDLGLPKGWTLGDALAAAKAGNTVQRRPVEVSRGDGGVPVRGFLLGAGAFVDATELAQHTHRVGAFNGVAVGLALGWAIMQTLFGPKTGSWRMGTPMRLRIAGQEADVRHRYLVLASTLGRLPAGLKPFGPARRGLKLLSVDAPPKRLWAGAPAVVAGSEAAWLERAGYHRLETTGFDLEVDKGFILDGELYAGGALSVRQGPKLSFVVP
jgi:hypothetical protein